MPQAGTIASVSAPITADASSGAISINGLGSGKVSGGYWGAVALDRPAFGGGAREIKNFQSIAATNIGAAVRTAGGIASVTGNGAITVTNTNTSNGPNMLFGSGTESFGIAALNTSGPTVINQNGAIYSDDWGIKATANGGSIAINGNNTVTAKRRTGIRAETGGGAISMIGNQAVTGRKVRRGGVESGPVRRCGDRRQRGNDRQFRPRIAGAGAWRRHQDRPDGGQRGDLRLALRRAGNRHIRCKPDQADKSCHVHGSRPAFQHIDRQPDDHCGSAERQEVEGAYLGMGIVTTTGVATVENFGMITQRRSGRRHHQLAGPHITRCSASPSSTTAGGLIGSIKTSGTQFSMFNHPSGFWLPATQAVPSSFNTPNDSVHNKGTIRLRNGVTLFGQLES